MLSETHASLIVGEWCGTGERWLDLHAEDSQENHQIMKEAGRKFSSITSVKYDAKPSAEMSGVRWMKER